MFRDKVVRYEVKPGESAEYEYAPPLVLGGNAFNTYRIGITLEQDGQDGRRRRNAAARRGFAGLEPPPDLRRSPASIIGCGVHFNFAPRRPAISRSGTTTNGS